MALKDRKTRKKRGSRTCGGGGAKKRRGAGHRGGRGKAGTKKHRKSKYLTEDPSYLVDKGPGRPPAAIEEKKAINIRALEERRKGLLDSGVAKEGDDGIEVDLSAMGYDKLLGGGIVRNKWIVKTEAASETAKKKIDEAGGNLVIGKSEES